MRLAKSFSFIFVLDDEQENKDEILMRLFIFHFLCRGDASLGPRELTGDWRRSDDLDTQRLQPPRVAGVDHDRSMARAA